MRRAAYNRRAVSPPVRPHCNSVHHRNRDYAVSLPFIYNFLAPDIAGEILFFELVI